MPESKPQTEKQLKKKDPVQGKVIKTTLSGAVIDIGLAKPAVIPISQLREEPVRKVEDVIKEGDQIQAWVRRVDGERVELTLIKPLLVEWRDLKADMALTGKVTKIEKFGAFVDLGTERPGLIHVSEISNEYVKRPEDVVKVGDEVQVKVIGVDRRKKQIKLSMKALIPEPQKEVEKPEEIEPEKPAPTAMEIALRKAMADQGEKPAKQTQKKPQKDSTEMEDILARTLENKLKSK